MAPAGDIPSTEDAKKAAEEDRQGQQRREIQLEENNMQFLHNKTFDRFEYQLNGRRECVFGIRFPMSLAYKFGFGENSLFVLSNKDVEKFLLHGRFYRDLASEYDKNLHLGHTKFLNVNYHPPYSTDLFENLKQLYVYCDIVVPQIVGTNALN